MSGASSVLNVFPVIECCESCLFSSGEYIDVVNSGLNSFSQCAPLAASFSDCCEFVTHLSCQRLPYVSCHSAVAATSVSEVCTISDSAVQHSSKSKLCKNEQGHDGASRFCCSPVPNSFRYHSQHTWSHVPCLSKMECWAIDSQDLTELRNFLGSSSCVISSSVPDTGAHYSSSAALCCVCSSSPCAMSPETFSWDPISQLVLFGFCDFERLSLCCSSEGCFPCSDYRLPDALGSCKPMSPVACCRVNAKGCVIDDDFQSFISDVVVSKECCDFYGRASEAFFGSCQSGCNHLFNILVSKVQVVFGIVPDCPLKAHTLAHFRYCDLFVFRFDRVSALYVYVDGGYKDDHDFHTTWGVSFVAEDDCQNLCVVLSACGVVPFNESSSAFLGESLPSNSFVAEVYAQVMARVLLLQFFSKLDACPSTPIYIMFDNKSADHVTRSSKPSRTLPLMVLFANVLDVVCASSLTMHYNHVASHDMHPYNDYADSLCTFARSGKYASQIPFGPISLGCVRSIDHYCALATGHVSNQVIGAVPSSPQECLSRVDHAFIAKSIDVPDIKPCVSGDVVISNDLVVVQYNVCSIKREADRIALASSFLLNNVFMLCIQEGRSCHSRTILKHGVIMCMSSAVNGNGGCEVWINPNVCVGKCNSKRFFVCIDSVSLMHTSDRCVVVSVRCGPYKFACISAHAPHHTSTLFSSWWKLFKNVFACTLRHDTHIVGGFDLNTTFSSSSVDGVCVGHAGECKQTHS